MTGTTLLRNANYKTPLTIKKKFKFDGYDGDIATRVYVEAHGLFCNFPISRTELKSL
jgi:hypothetical protein